MWRQPSARSDRHLKTPQELGRKKQQFFSALRMRCWQYLQLSILHCTASPPSHTPPPSQQACRLRYKAKQGHVIYWIPVHHGGCKCPVSKGATYASLSTMVSSSSLLKAFQSVAREQAGCHCGPVGVFLC